MTRSCILAIFIVAGMPLVDSSGWTVTGVAVAAATVLLTGLKYGSLRLTVIGSVLAICELALAQVSIGPAVTHVSMQPHFIYFIFVLPAAVGLALLYLVEEVYFAQHTALAHVDTAARRVRRRAQRQQGVAAVAIAAVVMLVAILATASGLPDHLQLSVSMRAAAAGFGSIIALVASFAGASGYRIRRSRMTVRRKL